MPNVQLALEGKARSNAISTTVTSPTTEVDVDLGADYESFILLVSATEAANLADASSLSFEIDGYPLLYEYGSAWSITKTNLTAIPGGRVHLNNSIVGFVRNISVVFSTTPDNPFTFSVIGINRLTKSTADEVYNRTLA